MATRPPGSAAGSGSRMRASDIVLDDERLGLAAKAVFVTLGMLGPSCSVEEVARRCRDGRAVVAAALAELEAHGYVSLDDGQVRQRTVAEFGQPSA